MKAPPSAPWRARGGAGKEKRSRKKALVVKLDGTDSGNCQEREMQEVRMGDLRGAGPCLDWQEPIVWTGGGGTRVGVKWPQGS